MRRADKVLVRLRREGGAAASGAKRRTVAVRKGTSISRPCFLRPVSCCMDHAQDRDDFTGVARNDFIGDDVGQAGHGFFVGTGHTPWAPRGEVFKLGSSLAQAIHDPGGSNRIIGCNIHQMLLEVVQRVTRPECRSCHRSRSLPAAATAAVNSAKAASLETRRPAATAVRPRLMPSIIACSLSR